MISKLYYTVSTTGTNPYRHSIYKITGILEKDSTIVDYFEIETRPHPKALIDEEALRLGGVTKEDVLSYKPMERAEKEFVKLLGTHINKFNPDEKIHLVGWNNRAFDDLFLKAWFDQCQDPFFHSLFWSDTIDVLPLASNYLVSDRSDLKNFKLETVAKYLGISTGKTKDPTKDPLYKIDLFMAIYNRLTYNI